MEIILNNQTYPLFFSMATIERIMLANKMTDFAKLAETPNMAESMKLARDCAFFGAQSGCRKNKIDFPYTSSDDIAEVIESFNDLEPALNGFTVAIESFFREKASK